jgi:cell division protein FtsQ
MEMACEPSPDDAGPPSNAGASSKAKAKATAKPLSARAERVFGALRFLAGTALVVGASWSVAWAARRYVTTSPRFVVTDVVVNGNKLRTPEQLAAEAKITKGQNVFTVDLDEARSLLARDPWVSEVTLGRRLPGTILVQVKEREAAALVSIGGDVYLATREGELFKRIEPGDPADLVVVTGVEPDAVADDREGASRAIRRALDLAGDYAQSAMGPKAPLQEIHLARDGSTTLVVGRAGMTLALGTPPFRHKLEQATRVLAELDRRGAKADAVLLDNDARPERVVVRMR